uniref:Protein THEM6 n=2 Tax=Monodelphis domestica TaxID=13616 RepID=F6S0A7_MONDO
MLWLLVALGLATAYFSLLDGWYLVRVPLAVLRASLLQSPIRDLLAEQTYVGRVLPSDIDLLLHMNNARYLREADVARAAHLTRCGVLGALRALGAHFVLASSCVRYRRSMNVLEPFEVRTRLLGWDGHAFYVESRFISRRDGFLCALLIFRQHVLGTTPDEVVQYVCKKRVESPEFSRELQHWISYNEASSQKLRAESGLSSTKDQLPPNQHFMDETLLKAY